MFWCTLISLLKSTSNPFLHLRLSIFCLLTTSRMTSVKEPQTSKKWGDVVKKLHSVQEEIHDGAGGAIFWQTVEIRCSVRLKGTTIKLLFVIWLYLNQTVKGITMCTTLHTTIWQVSGLIVGLISGAKLCSVFLEIMYSSKRMVTMCFNRNDCECKLHWILISCLLLWGLFLFFFFLFFLTSDCSAVFTLYNLSFYLGHAVVWCPCE